MAKLFELKIVNYSDFNIIINSEISNMSEDYQYACQRAELLGLSTPSEEEWVKSEEARKRNIVEDENLDDAKAQVKYSNLPKVK